MLSHKLVDAAGNASTTPVYIENIFSTYLYTGTGASRSITNNINLSINNGMVWIKDRTNAYNNNLFDTVQGTTKLLHSNTTAASTTDSNSLTAFNSTGFTLGSGNTSGNQVNTSADSFASWSFQKQTKFFDIQTYTGTGSAHTISHALGATPGCIIVKRTDTTGNWAVYHSGLNGGTTPQNYYAFLNTTAAQTSSSAYWNNTAPTSSVFTVGTSTDVNASGGTYIAYIFGPGGTGGFGLNGTDNVISCGVYSGLGAVNLGFEPQWILMKPSGNVTDWRIWDTMRGFSLTGGVVLNPNVSAQESGGASPFYPTATGFVDNALGYTNTMYIAIRRGPMATPTLGTSVFTPQLGTPSASPNTVTTGFPVDLLINKENNGATNGNNWVFDRLRGASQSSARALITDSQNAENTILTYGIGFDNNTGIVDNYNGTDLGITDTVTYWNFARAPGFFDVVCYAGTGSNTTQAHNLGIVPQLIIIKNRPGTFDWGVYNASIGNTKYLALDSAIAATTGTTYWNSTTPTSSVFSIGTSTATNASGANYVAYLFGTVSGVSYVGSYTGTAATQTINCGFGSSGARFLLIKRTDAAGDWYVLSLIHI